MKYTINKLIFFTLCLIIILFIFIFFFMPIDIQHIINDLLFSAKAEEIKSVLINNDNSSQFQINSEKPEMEKLDTPTLENSELEKSETLKKLEEKPETPKKLEEKPEWRKIVCDPLQLEKAGFDKGQRLAIYAFIALNVIAAIASSFGA
jgi:hypothetical protein